MLVCTRVSFVASLVALLVAVPALVRTQGPPASPAGDPVTKAVRSLYDEIRQNLTEGADLMPEEDYAFKITPEVRTFATLVAHVTGGNYGYCGAIGGQKGPDRSALAKMTTKAELTKALKESFAYCDAALEGMTDAQAVEEVQAGQNKVPRVRIMMTFVSHQNEHYGNMVAYLRLKNLVPPSTARQQRRAP